MDNKDEIIISQYLKNEDFHNLIEYCNEQINIDNNNYLILGVRGNAYKEIDNFDKAIDDISQALKLNKSYALGYYNRGICYYFSAKYELAISDLEKAKSMENGFYSIDFYLGGSYFFINNYNKAIELFSQHLIDYEDIMALKWRTDLFYLTGQNNEANKGIVEILSTEIANVEKYDELNSIPKTILDKPTHFNDLSDLGFYLFDESSKLSGVYILEFLNNEFYIGQSKKVKTRIKQHFKKYTDIKSIYFKSFPSNLLLEKENETIAVFEKNRIRIRNLKQINFINLFNKDNQKKWIDNFNYNITDGNKFNNEGVREDFHSRYLEFSNKEYFFEIVDLLAKYISYTIPNYIASEYNYWNITCLPKYLKKEKCIVRININAVPVLSIFEESNKSLVFMLYVSKLPYIQNIKKKDIASIFNKFNSLELNFRDAFEEKTQGDNITLTIKQREFEAILDNELICSSIRLFNLRMLNNSGKEIDFRRKVSHCLDLSDCIIHYISKMNS